MDSQGESQRVDAQSAGRDGAIDPFRAPIVSEAEKLGWTREQAIEKGRKLAEAVDQNDEDRIKRAMVYAAWDYDGRPASSRAEREEMGVTSPDIPGFSERAAVWAKRGEQ